MTRHSYREHADVVHRLQRELCPLRKVSASVLAWIPPRDDG
jgi:hypothetical protein